MVRLSSLAWCIGSTLALALVGCGDEDGGSSSSATSTLELSETALTFTAFAGGLEPGALPFTISNAGRGPLALPTLDIRYMSGEGWLEPTFLNVNGAPYAVSVKPILGNLTPGTYEAEIDVKVAKGCTNSPQTVAVRFTVSEASAGQYCAALYGAFAQKAASCSQALAVVMANSQPLIALECEALQEAVAAGRATFDAAKASTCVAWEASATCETFVGFGQQPDCLDAIVGTVEPGGDCTINDECANGFCGFVASCPGTCLPYRQAGESCLAGVCSRELTAVIGFADGAMTCTCAATGTPTAFNQFCGNSVLNPCQPGLACGAAPAQ
jgi:hypothetical protein